MTEDGERIPQVQEDVGLYIAAPGGGGIQARLVAHRQPKTKAIVAIPLVVIASLANLAIQLLDTSIPAYHAYFILITLNNLFNLDRILQVILHNNPYLQSRFHAGFFKPAIIDRNLDSL